MISDEEKDQVRAASDLVAIVQETVELKPRGHEFWGCCPFHGEKTPSFHIIPATQVWHCFGCGEGGDVFTYIMKRENLSFPESIRYLADRAGIELHDTGDRRERGTKRARIYDLCAETAQFYHTMLMRGKDGRPREYFASRGMGGDVCRRYCLGFAPGRNALVSHLSQAGFTPQEMIDANVAVSRGRGQLADRFYDRVMFPIFDEQGHNIAFGGRIMGDGQPKYLNTAETSVFHKKRNLYGFNWAKEFIVAQDTAIVVEGYTDCIACWEAGIKNVVATLGTSLTRQHIRQLSHHAKKRIIYLFDGDEAGLKSADIMIEGDNAYGFLKGEAGVHRLVRVSPFDAAGRRHTSFSAVEVIPEIPDDVEVEIRPEDIEMQVYRSSGAGGQHINKTSSAVRLIHKPTGIVVSCQTQRDQFQNKETCMRMLRSKLIEIKEREHLEKISDIKGVQLKIEWGSQIRSYVFMPYQLVKDTRTDYETGNIQAVMDGDLDGFINAYLTKSANGELKK